MDLERMNNPTEQVDFRRLFCSMAGIVASKSFMFELTGHDHYD